MEETTATVTAFAVGLAGGIVLGLAARLGKFCTLAAIEDALFAQNTTRWRMWVLAMAVAILGVYAAEFYGLIKPAQARIIATGFNPVSIVLGGLMFGVGMAFVGTCGFGTIVRLGGGDLKSLVVFFVLGLSAFMAASGPTAVFHLWFIEPLTLRMELVSDPRLHIVLAKLTGLAAELFAPAIALGLIAWVLSDKAFRRHPTRIAWGLLVGLVIASGWIGTGYVGFDAFDPQPIVSYTFIYPVGATLMYAMTSTASQLSFGVGSTVGVLLGAFAGALYKREWRWQTHDDTVEAKRQITGAFLMGTGGMYALGCTFGQGLSAIALLAVSAPLALASIWLGAWLGLLYLMEGSLTGIWRPHHANPRKAAAE
ncbi:MAG: YeeE/YedE family protein [Alphaproteobacteria bacterium]|nr:YeeE/YedE family protein [Alphaproteobacteria bacterium]